ncbi:hypothetical protein B0H14DRAFT_66285 [Mycena olivaceomarginata]|nr:hypothetical protein B0H14DRAFT_66285 [Mycena olivaceomarginata]
MLVSRNVCVCVPLLALLTLFFAGSSHLCACSDPSACSCALNSHALHSRIPKPFYHLSISSCYRAHVVLLRYFLI